MKTRDTSVDHDNPFRRRRSMARLPKTSLKAKPDLIGRSIALVALLTAVASFYYSFIRVRESAELSIESTQKSSEFFQDPAFRLRISNTGNRSVALNTCAVTPLFEGHPGKPKPLLLPTSFCTAAAAFPLVTGANEMQYLTVKVPSKVLRERATLATNEIGMVRLRFDFEAIDFGGRHHWTEAYVDVAVSSSKWQIFDSWFGEVAGRVDLFERS